MRRTTTIIPTQIDDPDAVAKLAEQGYTIDGLKMAIEHALNLAGDPTATKDEAAAAKTMLDKLTSMLPAQIDHDDIDVKITYSDGDRVVLNNAGGWLGATVIAVDGASYLVECDDEPGVTHKITDARIVPQAKSEGEGEIEHMSDIPKGWMHVPLSPMVWIANLKGEPVQVPTLNPGDLLRACPACQQTLTPDDEAAKQCPGCPRALTHVHIVGLEKL